jgi:hypothetical protein
VKTGFPEVGRIGNGKVGLRHVSRHLTAKQCREVAQTRGGAHAITPRWTTSILLKPFDRYEVTIGLGG